MKKQDLINKPNHYQSPNTTRSGARLEALDIIEAFNLNFMLGNAIKYLCRCDKKGSQIPDLKKAVFYINREIDNLQGVKVIKRKKYKVRKKNKWTKIKPHLRRAGIENNVTNIKKKRKPYAE